jgi:hypothetical protein
MDYEAASPMPSHSNRLKRLAPLSVLGSVLLIVSAGPALATEPSQCELAVEPQSGPAGTQFTLSGEGYTPTHLTLRKDSGRETTVELDLGDAEPFEIPIGSQPGDEGLWTATAYIPGTDCSATTTFRVMLLDTATLASMSSTPADGGGLPLTVYLLIGLLGFGGGTLIARRVRIA